MVLYDPLAALDILDRITSIVTFFGYWGIGALMLLENVIPPIPSELIMPLAGFAAARGEMSLVGAIASGTIGSVLGALVWYYIGVALGIKRICELADRRGKWFGISSKEIMTVQKWFANKGGYWAVGLGRMVPGIRTYISVPAGVTKMPFWPFLFYSTLGSLLWITLLTMAGYWLRGSYEQVSVVLGPVSLGVAIVVGLLIAGWLLYRWRVNSQDTNK